MVSDLPALAENSHLMRIGIFSVVDIYSAEDGRTTAQLYGELLEQVKAAEAAGLDSFWIAEHHFAEYGVAPRAAIWLAAAAQHTKRIRLGAAVVVLPFDNPLRTAEDYAMVDVLSQGRLSIGVGSGYLKHEFAGFNIPMEEKRERFDEALAVIMQGWTGQAINHAGKHFRFDNVRLNVLPLQKPTPPVAVAILNASAAEHVGAAGFNLMLIPYATTDDISELAATADAFNQGCSRASLESRAAKTERRIHFALHTVCAVDNETARKRALPQIERYVRTRLYARQRSFDELLAKDLIAAGSQDEIERVLKIYQSTGMTDFLAITNFGGMPHEDALESISILGKLAKKFAPSLTVS